MIKQLQQLKKKPRIIVGTPGRINDHLRQRTLKLDETDFLVLDETDRMLDMGFGAQLEQIAKYLPAARQTLMFSATLPANIISLSRKYLNNPVRIAVGATTAPAANIRQELIKTTDAAKYGELINQLQNREGSVLVFVKTKYGAERLAQKLAKENQAADAIHGDLRQSHCRFSAAKIPGFGGNGHCRARTGHSAYRKRYQLRFAAMPRRLHSPHRPYGARRSRRNRR